ncbi:hypothetical protein ABH915_004007 [Arthrobacter sp. MW3 TE3886]
MALAQMGSPGAGPSRSHNLQQVFPGFFVGPGLADAPRGAGVVGVIPQRRVPVHAISSKARRICQFVSAGQSLARFRNGSTLFRNNRKAAQLSTLACVTCPPASR